MRTPCIGYKKPCWIPATSNFLCATCRLLKERAEASEFIKRIPQQSHEEIMAAFPLLHRNIPFDQLMPALFKRSPNLLATLLKRNDMKASLLFHICYHTRISESCNIYGWMLRNNIYEDSIIPEKCFRCLSHTITNNNCWQYRNIVNKLWIDTRPLEVILSTTIPRDGLDDVYKVIYSLIESSNNLYNYNCLKSFTIIAMNSVKIKSLEDMHRFTAGVYKHPLLFKFPESRKIIKDTIDPWKEELIAKSWHPSRFQEWCIDVEEQKSMKKDGLEYEQTPFTQSVAAWNIRW